MGDRCRLLLLFNINNDSQNSLHLHEMLKRRHKVTGSQRRSVRGIWSHKEIFHEVQISTKYFSVNRIRRKFS